MLLGFDLSIIYYYAQALFESTFFLPFFILIWCCVDVVFVAAIIVVLNFCPIHRIKCVFDFGIIISLWLLSVLVAVVVVVVVLDIFGWPTN